MAFAPVFCKRLITRRSSGTGSPGGQPHHGRVHIQGVGEQDAGLALDLAFLVPLSLYISLGLAVAAALAVFFAWYRRCPPRLQLLALGIALHPLVLLAVVDLL
ncbi:hypothetical protein Thimo_1884 [Thioflavicoccus mobilis 8321]|uniref:Uncharacterized protein n=1 Tax=Thioflavicoccus mobilis 8321 TaxID=765912 RepID=L0GZ43_9GAMM|nr:hypothetical protein Thimo_1884 [Thioflavicoccus mobilis 8321]